MDDDVDDDFDWMDDPEDNTSDQSPDVDKLFEHSAEAGEVLEDPDAHLKPQSVSADAPEASDAEIAAPGVAQENGPDIPDGEPGFENAQPTEDLYNKATEVTKDTAKNISDAADALADAPRDAGRTLGATLTGVGEIGIGAGMIYGGSKIHNDEGKTNWMGRVTQGAGVLVASDGAVRAATGERGWAEMLGEAVSRGIER